MIGGVTLTKAKLKTDKFNMIMFGYEQGRNIIFCSNEYSSTSFAITLNDKVVRKKFLAKDEVCEPCFCHTYYVKIC